jgi:hypothetical protein
VGKRYVLLRSERALSPEEVKALGAAAKKVDPASKVIELGINNWVVVRTDSSHADQFRGPKMLGAGGPGVSSVLTSGSIGKLKSRAHGG